jgi:hypothetical protein
MFMIYTRTQFHMTSSNDLLDTVIIKQAYEKFLTAGNLHTVRSSSSK